MKKIIPLLFLFFLCIMCYFIYNITEDKRLYYMSVGDTIACNSYIKDNTKIKNYNTDFINKDYRIIDLLNILKYNEEITKNNKQVSIQKLLKKTDILIVSIGMNDIYYKLNSDTKEIFTYVNNMINDYEEVLKEINRYNYKKVYILGYYNITNIHNDIFTYVNFKLQKLTEEYGYSYIDLNKTINNNQEYLEKTDNYYLNKAGYSKIYNLIVENLKKT